MVLEDVVVVVGKQRQRGRYDKMTLGSLLRLFLVNEFLGIFSF